MESAEMIDILRRYNDYRHNHAYQADIDSVAARELIRRLAEFQRNRAQIPEESLCLLHRSAHQPTHSWIHASGGYNTTRATEESDPETDPKEGMSDGWGIVQSPDEDPYYVRPVGPGSGTGTTTWIKPMLGCARADRSFRKELEKMFKPVLQPEPERSDGASVPGLSSTSAGQDYYARVEARASRINAAWPSRDVIFPAGNTGQSRCSIFTEGTAVMMDEESPSKAVHRLVRIVKEGKDSICIIEDVNGHWIQALGAAPELAIPCEFFAGQASSHTRQPVRQGTYIPSMDDIIERALTRGSRILRKKNEESVNEIIHTLCEASVVVKTSVDNWMLNSVNSREINRAAACLAECKSVSDKLKEIATSVGRPADEKNPNSELISARALHWQMSDLEFLRLRRFFNLYATHEFEEHLPSDKQPGQTETSFFARNTQQITTFTPAESQHDTDSLSGLCSSDTQISYIRVDKTLCLILVDSQPSSSCFTPRRPGRSRVNLKLPHACAGSGIVVPELLEAPKPGLYESLKIFSQDAWHTGILCGEQRLPPTYEDYVKGLDGNKAPASSRSKLYTALDPQAFLLMLSSALWERNLRFLEHRLEHINNRRLRNAKDMDEMVKINDMLYDCREDLGTLVSQVEHARTHIPAYLALYYENFPMIRHRHEASYMSPVGHLPEMLKRAARLEKLILDNFQTLMSSVSVREGHESVHQTKIATGIALLAFVYVPLTLVTGIFGMNIKGQDGFVWWAPMLAFLAVILVTMGLLVFAWVLVATRKMWRKNGKVERIAAIVTVLKSALSKLFGRSKKGARDEEAAKDK